jgi:hypothetical protein
MQQLDWMDVAVRRDTGIRRAADHAERETPGWGHGALAFLRGFAAGATGPFLAEDVAAAYIDRGLPPPPDGRAWGSVFQRAARRGVIRRIGYAPARSSNGSPKPLWARP